MEAQAFQDKANSGSALASSLLCIQGGNKEGKTRGKGDVALFRRSRSCHTVCAILSRTTSMPRQARVVPVGVPHHITHRGNNRQDIFGSDEDRRRHQNVLLEQLEPCGIALLGWCLRSVTGTQLQVQPFVSAGAATTNDENTAVRSRFGRLGTPPSPAGRVVDSPPLSTCHARQCLCKRVLHKSGRNSEHPA